jgi:hypothetical protein
MFENNIEKEGMRRKERIKWRKLLRKRNRRK